MTITVASPNLVGGPQSTVTNAEGGYRINELPPGVFQLTAQLPGFQTVRRTDLRVLFGMTLTEDVVMPVATVEQLITVSGAAPAVDVKTAAPTTTMDRELLQNLPFSNDKRLVANVIELAPGSYSRAAFGAVRDANALLLDGFNMNFASLRGVAHDWIDEVQWDWPFLLRRPLLWHAVAVTLLVGGLGVTLTGLYLGLQVLIGPRPGRRSSTAFQRRHAS